MQKNRLTFMILFDTIKAKKKHMIYAEKRRRGDIQV